MFLKKEELPATVLENYSLKGDESEIALPGALENKANIIKAWLMSVFFYKFSTVLYDILVSLSSVEYYQMQYRKTVCSSIYHFDLGVDHLWFLEL